MFCQPNAPERATVLMTSLSVRFVDKTDIHIENLVNPSVLLRIMSDL